MTNYTDPQLKQALAKMLPDKAEYHEWEDTRHFNPIEKYEHTFLWFGTQTEIKDTELLHLCWMVEQELTPIQKRDILIWASDNTGCNIELYSLSWQQRVIALAKVKGIEIV